MKKILKFVPAILLVMICIFSSACSLGTLTINFETYGAYPLSPKVYSSGEIPSNLPIPFGKTGYNFLYWCWDPDLTEYYNPNAGAAGEITVYAKYEINESYFTGYTLNWSGSDSGINQSVDKNRAYLLNKTNTSYALSKIELQSTTGDLICRSLTVYDSNGKPVEDKNPLPEIWEPLTSPGSTAGKYVIIYDVTTFGSVNIFVS